MNEEFIFTLGLLTKCIFNLFVLLTNNLRAVALLNTIGGGFEYTFVYMTKIIADYIDDIIHSYVWIIR